MPTFNPAPMTQLGDKIIADINAVTWTPAGGAPLSFTAQRVYFLGAYPPTDTTLHVDLLLAEEPSEELADRGDTYERTYVVAIGVQQVLEDKTQTAAIDTLVAFVEALRVFYKDQQEFTVTGSQLARVTKREKPVVYSPEELDKDGRFFSVIHLTFEGWYTP